MRLIFTSYAASPDYTSPAAWLQRIEGYTGILQSLCVEHEVMGIERINYEGWQEHRGVAYRFLRQQKKIMRFPWRMHRFMRQMQPDVVLINGFIFPLQIIQLRLHLGRRVKIVILHRSEKPSHGYRKWLQQLADGCVDAYFFAASGCGKSWMDQGIIKKKEKIHEVIQGSSVFRQKEKACARQQLGLEGAPVFLWVGRLEKNKDPLTVVRAFLDFISVAPLARLYMIYQTEELLEALLDVISARDKAAQVVLVGKIAHSELENWFNAADFILSGSHEEGSGIAVCEAMSCGCIPVVTNIPSFRKMTGNCGLLYEAGNENSLLAALLKTRTMNLGAEQSKAVAQFGQELSFAAIARKTNAILAALP